ncbi:MAG: tetraacyldisaccharide 4'-kinase [Cyclobacteriaceae bacterium]|nr:tetraacyldisaccharide 4'-kinase [Cyclobacteriaceae bacterium]
MSLFRYLWWPFAVLVDGVTRLRNHLYAIGHKKSFQFATVVISIGNLNVGGSGKTPMIEYLIRLLSPHYKIATLSRGYGRSTRGFRIAGTQDNATTLGDEPYQLYKKFNSIYVAVGEERALAIPTILNECPDVQVILLDDAFQHRAVVPQFSVLVTDFHKPFFTDYLLPMGRLREARVGAARADALVVTKCPPSWQQNQTVIAAGVKTYAPGKPLYFATIAYGQPVPMGTSSKLSANVVLVTGIANAKPFVDYVAQQYKIKAHVQFADHHRYTPGHIQKINLQAAGCSIITTEKDMVKLIAPALQPLVDEANWFYLPMSMAFAENGSEFDAQVLALVAEKAAQVNAFSQDL